MESRKDQAKQHTRSKSEANGEGDLASASKTIFNLKLCETRTSQIRSPFAQSVHTYCTGITTESEITKIPKLYVALVQSHSILGPLDGKESNAN
jgi:hypothetical protein